MSTANTTVAIDPRIKSKAVARAKQDQLSISAVIRLFLLDYAEGRLSIGTRTNLTENGLTPKEEAEILKAAEEARQGKNTSKPFENINDIEKYLNETS